MNMDLGMILPRHYGILQFGTILERPVRSYEEFLQGETNSEGVIGS